MDILNLLDTISGFIIGGGMSLLCFKYYKKKMKAESESAEAEANTKEWHLERERIESLHNALMSNNETIANLTATIDSLTQRLSKQNATIDKLIDRNRELSDRAYKAEQALNDVNAKLLKVTEERDYQLRRADYIYGWRCLRCDCQDPRGREPENPKLKNLRYEEPQRITTAKDCHD